MAGENPTWRYDRLQGALANLGHTVASSTVANILKRHGIEPVPERGKQTSWRALREYSTDYLRERNHEKLDNHLLEESPKIVAFSTEPVQRRERLGGMFNFYYRDCRRASMRLSSFFQPSALVSVSGVDFRLPDLQRRTPRTGATTSSELVSRYHTVDTQDLRLGSVRTAESI